MKRPMGNAFNLKFQGMDCLLRVSYCMSPSATLHVFKKTLLIVPIILALLTCNAYCGVNGSMLRNVRCNLHDGFTRLVFDAEGARPIKIGPQEEAGIAIRFNSLKTSVQTKDLATRLHSPVSEVSIRGGDRSSVLYISLCKPDIRIKTSILGRSKTLYRIVLDFHPEAGSLQPTIAKPAKEKSDAQEQAKPDAPGSRSTSATPVIPPDNKSETPSVATGGEKVSIRYMEADSFFASHKDDLVQHAPKIIERYSAAMKAEPESAELPVALYRCGLVYLAIEDAKKAEQNFKRVITEYPSHPLLGLCWLGLGEAQQKRKADVEAVLAFRSALTLPLEKEKAVEANYAIGKSLLRIGSHKEAVEALSKCLEDDPALYLKKPEILRTLGESHFAVREYDKSRDYLLRYINIEKDIKAPDLILAKLAESMIYLHERDLADKVYSYIEKHYPDSEGYIVSKIRKAELLDTQNEKEKSEVIAMYRELTAKPLSTSLSELVYFKLASWEADQGNYEKSIALMEELARKSGGSRPGGDILDLMQKVVEEFTKASFAQKNYSAVINLYQENPQYFQSTVKPEIVAMVAESCGRLNLFPLSIEIYRQLLATAPDRKDEWLLKLGQYSYLMGDMDGAAQSCLQIRADSYNVEKSGLLGQICFSQRNYDEAAKHFSRCFEKDSSFERIDIQPAISYGESLLQLGKHTEALQLLKKVSRSIGSDDAEKKVRVGLLMSSCYQGLKQPEKAIEVLEELMPQVGSDQIRDELNYQLSMLCIETGQSKKAVEKLSKLMGSSQPFWKAAAEQQLSYMNMQESVKK
ncbi:MAG: tetratricopeptide repeat protein [Syntrophobacteraceae bacterium]